MDQSDSPKVIDLANMNANVFDNADTDHFLQSNGLERLKYLVRQQLDNIPEDPVKEDKGAIYYPRSHRAILVEGGRGSGKTTFVLNTLEELRQRDQALSRKLLVMRMIDPTLVETKENIVILILQLIEEAIEDANLRMTLDERKFEELDLALEALAEGLRLLDGIGPASAYGAEWEDAQWVMSRGLQKTRKGFNFELKLNRYIALALEILGKEAFVLAFDDVDTNFQHGHTILETIRKYLTSPQLVLILSGDLELYGRLQRKHIYATFGNDVIKHDLEIMGSDKKGLSNAVLELEEQYLLKILPPQNRIPMLPLGVLAGSINVRPSYGGATEELYSWAGKRVRKYLREGQGDDHPFLKVMSKEHLRLVLGYLQALDHPTNPNESDVSYGRRAVLRVFETRLRTLHIPTDLLDTNSFDYELRVAFEWIIGQEEPASLIRFGNLGEKERAIALHCIALAVANGMKDSGTVLKALLVFALPITMTQLPQLDSPEKRLKVFEFLWRLDAPHMPDIAARLNAIRRGRDMNDRQRPIAFGSVALAEDENKVLERVYGLASSDSKDFNVLNKNAKNNAARQWINLLKNKGSSDHTLLLARQNVAWFAMEAFLEDDRAGVFNPILNMIYSRRFNESGETQRSISALSLFAAISEILQSKNLEISGLVALAVEHTIPFFGSGQAGAESSVEELLYGVDSISNDEEPPEKSKKVTDEIGVFQTFFDHLKDWHKFARKLGTSASISPALLGTLASRLFDDLHSLDQFRDPGLPTNSGEIFHRQVTIVLNAAVAMTAGETVRKRESPKTSDAPLGRVLARARSDSEQASLHPLAAVLLSCPLVWAFLNPKAEYRSGSNTENLRNVVRETLKYWNDTNDFEKVNESNFDDWTTAPEVTIKIGNIQKTDGGSQRTITVEGFYDLLNVMPRYAETKRK